MLEVLSLAERLEAMAAEIYQALTDRFPPGSEGHGLFGRLKEEELQHLQRVELLQRRYMRDKTTLREGDGAAEGMRGVLEVGQGMLSRVQDAEPMDLEQATQLALDLEQRFAVAHADAMLASGDQRLRGFFEQLAQQDRAHAKLLAGQI